MFNSPIVSLALPPSTHTCKEQHSEGFMSEASEMCVPFQEGQPSNIRSNSLCIHLHFSASLSECLGSFYCESQWLVQIDNVSNC